MSMRSEFWAGLKDTTPLVIGAIPFGIIFGALSVTAGISPLGTMGLSLFVFAGSSQFIAANLFAGGSGAALIILTTFIVNLRHALYATTLGPHMRSLSQRWLLPLGFLLTDETFVVTANRYNQPDDSPSKHWYFFGSAIFMYTNWQLCTLIGVLAGQAIPDPLSWGLDFAMSVTFIGMVVPLVTSKPMLATVIISGLTAVAANGLPNKIGLISGAVIGVGAGVFVETLQKRKAENHA